MNARSLRHVASVAASLILSGCAVPQSYVVLLGNDDGTVGKVSVTGNKGSTLLERAQEATFVAADAGTSFDATREQIQKDFGAALAASPRKPARFLLYFQAGGASLTPESEHELDRVRAEIGARKAPDISIIGHTDTTGESDVNEQLGMERAGQVSARLSDLTLPADKVAVESHGEKNLLVATPDNTDEPRNRRVEITVR